MEAMRSMFDRVLKATAIAALAWSCVACTGTADGLSSVSGKILCNGQPAAGAVLVFHRESGGAAAPANVSSVIPSAVASDDGSFTVETQPIGYGAAPGKYKVLVQWPEDSDTTGARSSSKTNIASVAGKKVTVTKRNKLDPVAPDRLKGRYMDSSKPQFHAEVKAGSTDLGTFELELKN
jgi:hypothetical protein